ncbi:putative Ig domain-containing protein [uncultured Nocardioides sp.]|uniref:putative Ig domain-containing protein n=1 Tax=uncultured Nocardioides sp. TaxID=198441 RepID=UPI002633A32A|nr:putative Ig domain-containing protein [uncultured Nocardioides sp.]HRD60852.1 putative Ig domain-containing protein [Nocardioides sp.]
MALTTVAAGIGTGLTLGPGAGPGSAADVPRVEIVKDGGFEANVGGSPGTNPSWSATSSRLSERVLCTVTTCPVPAPRMGRGWMRFGTEPGYVGGNTATVSQQVTIPAGSTHVDLYYYLRTGVTSAPYNATVTVKMDSTVLRTHTQTPTPDSNYTAQTVNLKPFADGRAHTLSFVYNKPSAGQTVMVVDDVSIQDRGLRIAESIPDAMSINYSDGITASFTATTEVVNATAMSATATGLPAGLSVVKTSQTNNGVRPSTATWAVQGTVTAPPGRYPVTINVSDGVSPVQPVKFTVDVTAESAAAAYTGPTSAAAPRGGDDAVDLTLTANVTQVPDGTAGDLSRATAAFVDTTTGQTLCTSGVTPAGKASCRYLADLPAGNAGRIFKVKVTIGGSFAGTTSSDSTLGVWVANTLQVAPPPASATTQFTDTPDVSFSASSPYVGSTLTATASGLPAGLALQKTGTSASATWRIVGTVTGAPGTYNASITVTDGPQSKTMPLSIRVNPENATVTYTGPTAADLGPLQLSARVTQAADGSLGQLGATGERLAFGDENGVVLCDAPVAADGTAACSFTMTRAIQVSASLIAGSFVGSVQAPTLLAIAQGISVTPPPATATTQFTDGPDVTFSATSDRWNAALAATATGLPAGLSLQQSGSDGAAMWRVTGAVTAAPGQYDASIRITDGIQSTTVPLSVQVKREDATVTYTGPTIAELGQTVSLTALVTQAADGSQSQFGATGAVVLFTDELGGILCQATVSASGESGCTFTMDGAHQVSVGLLTGNFVGGTPQPTLLALSEG